MPAGWTQSAWRRSLFDSYGGGAFVPSYSSLGAYVLAGTGGHGHPDNIHAVVFDFATASWALLPCANDVLDKGPSAYSVADTNDRPLLEIVGTEVPAPPHPYATLAYSPDGPRGSVIYVSRAATVAESRTSTWAHRFDLSTRTWSRYGTGSVDSNATGTESSAVWDADRDRWWLFPRALHYATRQAFLDRVDQTWKYTARGPAVPSASSGPISRYMLHGGCILRNTGPDQGLWLFDPDDAGAGWHRVQVSGTLPDGRSRWARYSDGCWYAFQGRGTEGNTLTRILPPSDIRLGTWIVDTVALSGELLPATSGFTSPAQTSHYTRFFYVEALDVLCWIPGADRAVYLIRPPYV